MCRKEQLDQAAYQPPREPFDFAQGRLHYLRGRRNRSYLVVSALVFEEWGWALLRYFSQTGSVLWQGRNQDLSSGLALAREAPYIPRKSARS